MIKEIEIKNYKSVTNAKLELGRVNVFIGENGAGKSNILEIIALAGATAAEKLDNEFLASRGIRVTKPEHMRPAFPETNPLATIEVSVKDQRDQVISYFLRNDNMPYSKWHSDITTPELRFDADAIKKSVAQYQQLSHSAPSEEEGKKDFAELLDMLSKDIQRASDQLKKLEELPQTAPGKKLAISFGSKNKKFAAILKNTTIQISEATSTLGSFVIYSPENSLLRTFEKEGQILPLGVNGEGLLKLLSFYASEEGQVTLHKVKESLQVLDWFDDFHTIGVTSEAQLYVKDRYLDDKVIDFDYRSTNEGFFFLLFYFTLFNSQLTPKFFAIDNIDASLNPKLCEKLTSELVKLSKANDKQVILTTHNPAVLDGLNLDDDEQRLFAISRNMNGETKIRRIAKPASIEGKIAPKLSELFLRGMIGGLPVGF